MSKKSDIEKAVQESYEEIMNTPLSEFLKKKLSL